jgi:hypothetical protein
MTSILEDAHVKASAAAKAAATEFSNRHFGGRDGGMCGFAWVTFYPAFKGNTRDGKVERKRIEGLGFRKDWTGKAYQLWDPAKYPGQSVDAKSAGAAKYAEVLFAEAGVRVYAEDRLD